MDDVIAGANARPRFTLVLLATFAVVALVLAAVGHLWRHQLRGVSPHARDRRARGARRQPGDSR